MPLRIFKLWVYSEDEVVPVASNTQWTRMEWKYSSTNDDLTSAFNEGEWSASRHWSCLPGKIAPYIHWVRGVVAQRLQRCLIAFKLYRSYLPLTGISIRTSATIQPYPLHTTPFLTPHPTQSSANRAIGPLWVQTSRVQPTKVLPTNWIYCHL